MKRRNQTQKVRQLNYQLFNKNRRELNLSKLPQTYQIQTSHLKKTKYPPLKSKHRQPLRSKRLHHLNLAVNRKHHKIKKQLLNIRIGWKEIEQCNREGT